MPSHLFSRPFSQESYQSKSYNDNAGIPTKQMKELHWLPVRQRIEFKINMITYKGKNNLAPGYVSDMTEAYNRPKLNMTLRSSKQNQLDEKWSKHKRSGDRAYSVCGPKLWNLVPLKIRKLPTVELFKKELKTDLFKKAFKLWYFLANITYRHFTHIFHCIVSYILYCVFFMPYMTVILHLYSYSFF